MDRDWNAGSPAYRSDSNPISPRSLYPIFVQINVGFFLCLCMLKLCDNFERRRFATRRTNAHCRYRCLRLSITFLLFPCKLCHDVVDWERNNEIVVGRTPSFRTLAIYECLIKTERTTLLPHSPSS
jgi:hypothetical protein